jgi:iron complex transport system ATP-binding protein
MTTHFPDYALMTADRVILMRSGQVIADGLPQEVITRDSLRELYRIEVNVTAIPGTNGAGRVCIPVWTM